MHLVRVEGADTGGTAGLLAGENRRLWRYFAAVVLGGVGVPGGGLLGVMGPGRPFCPLHQQPAGRFAGNGLIQQPAVLVQRVAHRRLRPRFHLVPVADHVAGSSRGPEPAAEKPAGGGELPAHRRKDPGGRRHAPRDAVPDRLAGSAVSKGRPGGIGRPAGPNERGQQPAGTHPLTPTISASIPSCNRPQPRPGSRTLLFRPPLWWKEEPCPKGICAPC